MGFERGIGQPSRLRSADAAAMEMNLGQSPGHDGCVPLVPASSGPEQFPRSAGNLLPVALTSRDAKSVALALGMIEPQLPLDPYQTQALGRRLQELIDDGAAFRSPELARAIAHFLHAMARVRADSVSPFIPALLAFMEKDLATTGAFSYYALMIVAEEAPDVLCPFAGVLVEKLHSRSYAVQTLSTRIITRLAVKCPAFLSGARYDLWNLYRNSADGPLKIEAQRAMQVLFSRGQPGTAGADSLRKAVAMDAHRGQSAIARLLFSIMARFLNFWRMLIRRDGESSEMARIAEDLREISRWVEARFPSQAGSPLAENAIVFPDRSTAIFPRHISPHDELLPARRPLSMEDCLAIARTPASRPSGESVVARPLAVTGRTLRDSMSKRSHITNDSGKRYLVRGSTDAGRNDRTGVMASLRTVEYPPGDRKAGPEPEKQLLLSKIRGDIDDSLHMARVPVMSLAEIYSKPTSDNKVPDAWSRSRTGHYVKKRTHGNAHISRMRENLTF